MRDLEALKSRHLHGRFVQMDPETTGLTLELELVKGERSAILVSMEVGGLHSIQVKTR